MLIDREALRLSPTTWLFEGSDHGMELSFFVVDYPSGQRTRLHVHPHPEVFIVESGEAEFVVDGQEIHASAGHILIAPAGKPHGFRSVGASPFRSVNVVPNSRMEFTWLEDEPAPD